MKPANSSIRLRRRLSRTRWLDTRGQSVIEAALVVPFLVLVCMGVVELGSALRNQHEVISLSREGSNLISRSTTLQDAATALTSIQSGPVDFSSNATLIFSVIERGATVGSANYNKLLLYQRYQTGSYSAVSKLTTSGTGSFGGAPDYKATNPDSDTSLQVTNAPAGLVTNIGGLSYVTEIFSSNALITALAKFGITVPTQLYSVAYF